MEARQPLRVPAVRSVARWCIPGFFCKELSYACVTAGRAESFVTCDDRILKRARQGKLGTHLMIGTPIEFVATRKKTNGES